MEQHSIPPIYNEKSKVLILGSFPSVKSREVQFYYGHSQNRFWRVLAEVIGCDIPSTIAEKEAMLLKNNIALWNVIASCDIDGSDDSSIRNVAPNDLRIIFETAEIKQIFTNGGTADKLYRKHCLPQIGIPATRLPSTSPANAGSNLDRLIKAWQIIGESLK